MTDRFHISPDGNPRPCSAEIKCKYGEGTPHYKDKDEARAAFEAAQKAADAPKPKVNLAEVKSNSWALNAYRAFDDRRNANESYVTLIPEAEKVIGMIQLELDEGNLTGPAKRQLKDQQEILRFHLKDWKDVYGASKYLDSFTPQNEKKLVHLAKSVFGTRAGEDLQDDFIRGDAEKVRDSVGELMEQASDSVLADHGLTYPKLRAMLDSGH